MKPISNSSCIAHGWPTVSPICPRSLAAPRAPRPLTPHVHDSHTRRSELGIERLGLAAIDNRLAAYQIRSYFDYLLFAEMRVDPKTVP